jgi:hypothetical protein
MEVRARPVRESEHNKSIVRESVRAKERKGRAAIPVNAKKVPARKKAREKMPMPLHDVFADLKRRSPVRSRSAFFKEAASRDHGTN